MLTLRRRALLLCGFAGCLGLSGWNSPAQVAGETFPARNSRTLERTTTRATDAGRFRYQGDILLRQNNAQAGAAVSPSFGLLNQQNLWPKVNGVATVYYIIDPSSDPNATSKINTAISTSNGDFPGLLQWVPWTSNAGSAYVDINLNAGDTSGECEASEGFENLAAQPMTGSTKCTVSTILH